MKAIVYDKYGPPAVLRMQEVEKPEPKDREIRVKVYATTVTVADIRSRSFTVPRSVWLPARLMIGLLRPRKAILGMELAGEVEAVGHAVRRFQPGDRVFAATLVGYGAYAEYRCLPEDGAVAHMPANLSFEEAAAVPIGARTALHFLRKADVRRGQRVLIYGASGSVGSYALQLAKVFGAHVTAVCGPTNAAMVRALGADEVIDYTKEDFTRRGAVYDVVFEAVDKSSFDDCMKVLKASGVYINVTVPVPSIRMLWTKITSGKRLILGQNSPETAEALYFLKELIEAGKLKPWIDRVYPFEQMIEAHRYVDQGHKKGNVAVTLISSESPESLVP